MNAIIVAGAELLEAGYSWWGAAYEFVITATWAAALLAVVVLAINIVLRRRISAGQMGFLWCLVLIRLLIPIAPQSVLSLQSLFNSASAFIPSTGTEPWGSDAQQVTATSYYADGSFDVQSRRMPPAATRTAEAEMSPVFELALDAVVIPVGLLTVTWLPIGLLGLAWTLMAHGRLCRQLNRTSFCQDSRLVALWDECCRAARVRRMPRVQITPAVTQPAVLGALRPRLLLPIDAAEFNDSELRMIMLHELAHVRRFDLAFNWLLVVIRSLQWWSPVYWLAASRYRALREQACDAFVLRQLAAEERPGYGELLLTLAARNPQQRRWRLRVPASILGLLPSWLRTRGLRGRIRALRAAPKQRGRLHTAIVTAAIAVLFAVGMTDARTLIEPELPPVNPLAWLPAGIVDECAAAGDPPIRVLRKGAIENAAGDADPNVEGAGNSDGASNAGPHFIVQCLAFVSPSNQLSVDLPWRYNDVASVIDHVAASTAQETATLGQRPSVRVTQTVNDGRPVAVRQLTALEAQSVMQRAKADHRNNMISLPELHVADGQQGSIQNGSTQGFVVGLVPVHEDDQPAVGEAYGAAVSYFDSGCKLNVKVSRQAESDLLTLSGHVEFMEVGNVRTAFVKGEHGLLDIQVPTTKNLRVEFATPIEPDQSLLVGCVHSLESRRFMYVLLNVREEPADHPFP